MRLNFIRLTICINKKRRLICRLNRQGSIGLWIYTILEISLGICGRVSSIKLIEIELVLMMGMFETSHRTETNDRIDIYAALLES